MMLDMAAILNMGSKTPKKPVAGVDGELVAEFINLLGVQVAEGETAPSAKDVLPQHLAQETDAWPMGDQSTDTDIDAEDVFDGLFIPDANQPVFPRVTLRPIIEVVTEPEPGVPLVALDGKMLVHSAETLRPPVQVESPLEFASPVTEKVVRLEELANRFDQRLLSMVQRNEKVMKITLHPASMGRLTVVCSQENSTLSVEIMVQSSSIRELIAGQEEAVRRLMQDHAVEMGSFDVLLDQKEKGKQHFGSGPWSDENVGCGTAPALNEEGDPLPIPVENKGGAVSLIA